MSCSSQLSLFLQPNCYSRVISVNNDQHIIIFAKRDIKQWEELTYDYRFFHHLAQLFCHSHLWCVKLYLFMLQILFYRWTTCVLLWLPKMPRCSKWYRSWGTNGEAVCTTQWVNRLGRRIKRYVNPFIVCFLFVIQDTDYSNLACYFIAVHLCHASNDIQSNMRNQAAPLQLYWEGFEINLFTPSYSAPLWQLVIHSFPVCSCL